MSAAQEELAEKLARQWGLELPEIISEQEILNRLTARISTLLQGNAETFFQLMYKLDIPEKKLNQVLHNEEAPVLIAKLIYDRQLQKIESRRQHKGGTGTADDPELQW